MANFLIIKYKIEMQILAIGVCWQWAKVTERSGKAYIEDINRDRALQLIKGYGLSLALKNSDGEVYDDGEFYNQWKHGKLIVKDDN